jgi:26S proteasome regulatory subunit N5
MKLRYYDLMVQLALQDDAYLEACSAYQEVWDTEEVKKDEGREINVSCDLCQCHRLTANTLL